MTAMHTPGPWHADPTKSFYVFAHGSLAEQAGVENGPFICNASTQANARLIAAAPDLLAAAQDALRNLRPLAVHPSHYAALENAIAKATGADV